MVGVLDGAPAFLVFGGLHKARKRYMRDVVSAFSKDHHFWCSMAFSRKTRLETHR
jgi:hypothetical protein